MNVTSKSRRDNQSSAVYAVELAYDQQTLKQIDLHGCMLDEVETQIDQFVSAMSSARELGCAIVCGLGTGAMKKRVLELLQPYRKSMVETVVDVGGVLLVVFKR